MTFQDEGRLDHKYRDTFEKAKQVIYLNRQTFVRRIFNALIYACEVAVLSIVIPIITTDLTGLALIWPVVTVMLVVVILRIIIDERKLLPRAWWARQFLSLMGDWKKRYAILQSENKRIEDGLKEGEVRLRGINAALPVLERVIKSDVLAIHDAVSATATSNSKQAKIAILADAKSIKADLKSLCEFICNILAGPNQTHLRCGILIKDPKNQNNLIPIVVYDPKDSAYRSQHTYSAKDDFSGQLLSSCEVNLGTHDWKERHAVQIISDIDSINPSELPFRSPPIRLRSNQQEYIKWIAGNVIFCRNRQGKTMILGAINIDSDKPNAVDPSRYRELQPYLYPCFRLFASRLLLLRGHPGLVHTVWNLP